MIAQTSGVGILILVFVSLLDLAAISQIILKAGYSVLWMLLPIASVVLAVLYVVDVRETHFSIVNWRLVSSSDGSLRTLAFLFDLSVFVNWIFFLIFAFRRWPILDQAQNNREEVERYKRMTSLDLPISQRVSADSQWEISDPQSIPSPPAATVAVTASGPNAAGLEDDVRSDEPEVASPEAVIYCSWCGTAREASSYALHVCGPQDQPPSFCFKCGAPLPPSLKACPGCGTATSETSRQ